MSCDHELANEKTRCSGKNASYITILIIIVPYPLSPLKSLSLGLYQITRHKNCNVFVNRIVIACKTLMKKGSALRNIGYFQYMPSPLYQPCSFYLFFFCNISIADKVLYHDPVLLFCYAGPCLESCKINGDLTLHFFYVHSNLIEYLTIIGRGWAKYRDLSVASR